MAIVCKRELEIRDFEPQTYFEVVATAEAVAGQLSLRHAPEERILKRTEAEAIAAVAEDFEAPLRFGSKMRARGRRACTTCLRCRKCAARASAGRPAAP